MSTTIAISTTDRAGRAATADSRTVALVLGAAGLALLPWIVVLAAAGPEATGWAVLDALEAVCLLGTAGLLLTGRPLHRAFAALAALLLAGDALVDLRTAPAGSALLVALAMALLAELPLAALCGALALRRGRGAARSVTGRGARAELALAA
ncbi:hypothetical protein GCM10009665_02150 [Kitasatospora nipponensis]|uniref:Uncharacterized protein n=1 Tax=Kitasatospora nipponensis TaxID=258049 RepID=A0ABP4GA75_9ACTN